MNSSPVFLIAEVGANHNGSISLAEKLIDAAGAAHADAVEFQAFRAGGLDEEAHLRLQARAHKVGIEFLSASFDEESADMLERIVVGRYKIPAREIANKGLIERVARKGKPVMLAAGPSGLDETRRAVGWIRAVSGAPLTVLHCVAEHPAPLDRVNLRALASLRDALGLPVGYSDRALGTETAVAAAALGATVIAKHLTLDRSMPGAAHAASLEPERFAVMVRQIRAVSSALGDGALA